MFNFTLAKLVKERKTVPSRLLHEQCGDCLEWQIGDNDILSYNTKTKQFSLDVYEFQNDDWECVNTLGHEDAYQVALDDGIIYE